jgi:uncharacterized protein DUF6627
MRSAATQLICRFLAIALLMLPYQGGQAGMVGTDQAAAASSVQADRNTISSFLSRAQIATELQSLGLDPQAARDRVSALTDAEASSLAGKISALPAGADGGLVVLILVVLLVWLIVSRR